MAVRLGKTEMMKLLLDSGKIDGNLKDFKGYTALQWAARINREGVVKLLLNNGNFGKIDVDLQNKRRNGITLGG